MNDLNANATLFENHPAIQAGVSWFVEQLAPFVQDGLSDDFRKMFVQMLTYGLAERFTGRGIILKEDLRFEGDQELELRFQEMPSQQVQKAARRLSLRFTPESERLNVFVRIGPKYAMGHVDNGGGFVSIYSAQN